MAVAGAATIAAACTAAAVLSSLSSSSANSDEARSCGGGATAGSPLPDPSSHECAVCLSELPEAGAGAAEPAAAVRALPACGHAFHAECIGRWLPLRRECPLCRRPVLLAAGGGQGQKPAVAVPAPAWARPATIACGFGDGRVVWTRSPSARQ